MMNHELEQFINAFQRLDTWMRQENYLGWDPYDGLNSSLLHKAGINNHLANIIFTQLVKRSPINLRPLLGIHKGINAKGMGLLLNSYSKLYSKNFSSDLQPILVELFNWLADNTAKQYKNTCWGYNFPWANRDFHIPTGTPNAIATCFIGLAIMEIHRLKLNTELFNMNPLDLLINACEFIMNDLNQNKPSEEEICFSYTPLDNRYIHNVNLLCAQFLFEVYEETKQSKYLITAEKALQYTIHHQLSNGAWYYGENKKEQWIDNFHTAYILAGLHRINEIQPSPHLLQVISRGYTYWENTFFTKDKLPKYFSSNKYPLDMHNIAQAIITFCRFKNYDADALLKAKTIAAWAINNMQDKTGYFYFQKNMLYTIKIPYMRWAQAWMHRALSELISIEQ